MDIRHTSRPLRAEGFTMSIIHTLHSAQAWDLAWDLARNFQPMQGWSYPAFRALFNHMDEMSTELGEQMEFDPIAWANEYSFWPSAEAYCRDCYADQYAELAEENESNKGDGDSLERACFNYLSRHTTIIYSNGCRGLVVEDF